MNFDKYQNTLEYPTKGSFTEVVEAISSRGLKKPVSVFDEQGYHAAVRAYHEEDFRIRREFTKDLLEELGLTDHPKGMKLIEKAWDHGHSSGYSEVANWAYDLSELLS